MSDLIFDESTILLDLESDTKEDVLTKMGSNLVDKELVKESYIDAVIKRENEFATGLPTSGVSVAIPHTDVEHVNQKTISMAVLKEPVEFGVMGDDSETTPVKVVFMLAMDQPHSQLTLLQKLMQVFQDEDTLQFLVTEKDKTKVKDLLTEKLAFEGGE
ncbi:PTS sugar transporter subunit IIA [Oceanobacillus halotolerans]|uniref:PTS sugar transporter subunit IIA n=1 Tax=Oceanobacillus halotolerans TaxID=2663380 RepID=UPI0013D985F5|nr:PTS sugar transporter subunit IIA [Oceanobacillus halotolerans]